MKELKARILRGLRHVGIDEGIWRVDYARRVGYSFDEDEDEERLNAELVWLLRQAQGKHPPIRWAGGRGRPVEESPRAAMAEADEAMMDGMRELARATLEDMRP